MAKWFDALGWVSDSAAPELCYVPGNQFLNNTVTVWYKDVLIKSYRYKNMCMIGLDAIKNLCKLNFILLKGFHNSELNYSSPQVGFNWS